MASTPARRPSKERRRSGFSLKGIAEAFTKGVEGFIDKKVQNMQLKSMLHALTSEDEEKAMALYAQTDKNGRCLQLDMHPSLPIGPDDNTPLHLAASGAMFRLIRLFMQHGGVANGFNALDQTSLHAVCGCLKDSSDASAMPSVALVISQVMRTLVSPSKSLEDADASPSKLRLPQTAGTRLQCLKMLLDWRGMEIDGVCERVSINAVDERGNTALHYAATHGLSDCCDFLISSGGILTLVNKTQETPCDLAGAAGHSFLADALEARMIFGIVADAEVTGDALDFDALHPHFAHGAASGEAGEKFTSASADTLPAMATALVEETRGLLQTAGTVSAPSTPEGMVLDLRNAPATVLEAMLHASEWHPPQCARRVCTEVEELLKEAKVPMDLPAILTPTPSDPRGNRVPAWATPGQRVVVDVSTVGGQPLGVAAEEKGAGETAGTESVPSMHGRLVEVVLPADPTAEPTCVVFVDELMEEIDQVALSHLRPEASEAAPVAAEKLETCSVCGEATVLLRNLGCGHGFCSDCWGEYIKIQLREGGGSEVVCAQYDCHLRVDDSLATNSLSDAPDLMQRWQRARSSALVGHLPQVSYCPGESCQLVICREGSAWRTRKHHPLLGNARCANGHSFCWECRGAPHAPCPCDLWSEWKAAVREHMDTAKEVVDGGAAAANGDLAAQDLGNLLWLAANTKQCPKCKTPTEKNEGCNHMTCKRCRHEYCWICMQPWQLHSNETGGFFRCNRFDTEEVTAATRGSTENRGEGSAAEEARKMKKRARETERFIHHYTRFGAHGESSDMEQRRKLQTLDRVRRLQASVHSEIGQPPSGERSHGEPFTPPRTRAAGSFEPHAEEMQHLRAQLSADRVTALRRFDAAALLEAAFDELEVCRLILRNSYAFSFFVLKHAAPNRRRRQPRRRQVALQKLQVEFETLQSELEMLTETLSEIVARRYIRASCLEISNGTKAAMSKRIEFYVLMIHHFTAPNAGEQRSAAEAPEEVEEPDPLQGIPFDFAILQRLLDETTGAVAPPQRRRSRMASLQRHRSATDPVPAGRGSASEAEGEEGIPMALRELFTRPLAPGSNAPGANARPTLSGLPVNFFDDNQREGHAAALEEEEEINRAILLSMREPQGNQRQDIQQPPPPPPPEPPTRALPRRKDKRRHRRSSPLPEPDQAVTTGEWICPQCTLVNTAGLRQCSLCGGDRPTAAAPRPVQMVTETATDSPSPVPQGGPTTSWTCAVCTLINTADDACCIACRTEVAAAIQGGKGAVVSKNSCSRGSPSLTRNSR